MRHMMLEEGRCHLRENAIFSKERATFFEKVRSNLLHVVVNKGLTFTHLNEK